MRPPACAGLAPLAPTAPPPRYFANERTFIQWLSAAILLVTLSTAIMTFDQTARVVGTIFAPVALAFMYYALGVYQWRLKKINARDGSRFDDPYGSGSPPSARRASAAAHDRPPSARTCSRSCFPWPSQRRSRCFGIRTLTTTSQLRCPPVPYR